MVLIKVDKHNETTELRSEETFIELSRVVNELIKEYEENGLMLIRDEANGIRGRITEFASGENGWECGLFIAGSWLTISNMKQRPPEDNN